MTQALEKIWIEFADQLRAFIRRRMADDAEAEDILQDVFLKLARRRDQLPAPEKLPGWIFLLARNAIIDRYRTRKTNVPVPETLALEGSATSGELEGLCAAFRRMIRNLPEPYREAIVLAEIEGVPQVEMARRLGISASGAKSRVQRGRRLLKEMLLACCQFEFDRRGGLANCEPHGKSGCVECE
jgi:RNA polymerase sigma-70 factor (ECF subfamily)